MLENLMTLNSNSKNDKSLGPVTRGCNIADSCGTDINWRIATSKAIKQSSCGQFYKVLTEAVNG
jgi:hypothetical protein